MVVVVIMVLRSLANQLQLSSSECGQELGRYLDREVESRGNQGADKVSGDWYLLPTRDSTFLGVSANAGVDTSLK